MELKRYEDFILKHMHELQGLIRIPSVSYESNDLKYPFGKQSHEALMYMKDILEKYGLETINHEEKVVFTSIGSGERIDIASHLDVVIALGDWKKDPYCGDFDGNELYGRGSQDMKSSAFLVFLAALLLLEDKKEFNREIRLVYGSDEERTMDDMRSYVNKYGQPDFAFSPDGSFPICIEEKGALMWECKRKYDGKVIKLYGGKQPNVIIGEAYCEIKANKEDVKEYLDKYNHLIEERDDNLFITFIGKSAHASLPEKGDNAMSHCLKFLAEYLKEDIFIRLAEVFEDSYGIGAKLVKEKTTLTINLGLLELKDNELIFDIDCRYPADNNAKDLTESLKKTLYDFEVALPYNDNPCKADKNSKYVKALKDAYLDYEDTDEVFFVSGGVSYAKVFERCVGFGPMFPYCEQRFHQNDEKISLQELTKALAIYHRALENLIRG